jgi:hypothetical protein
MRKADNDLLIEQLKETFRVLAGDKVPVAKLEKRLDDVAHKWEEVKKQQPHVKGTVEPVQVCGGEAGSRGAGPAAHMHQGSGAL